MRAVISANTIPACFYERYRRSPDRDFYFSKKSDQWVGITYRQGYEFIRRTLAGLKKFEVVEGEKIALLSENRYEWMLTDYAIQWAGAAVVGIYTTSSPDQISYILNESKSVGIICSNQVLAEKVLNCGELTHLKWIVVWDGVSGLNHSKVKLVTRDDFLKVAIEEPVAEAMLQNIREENLAMLLYTSGTTGEPKGVMLSQKSMCSNIKSIFKALPFLEEDKVSISILPMSHIYERVVHSVILFSGAKIYFAESIDKLVVNLSEVKPQLLTAVPRIFEKIYVRVQEKVKSSSWLKRNIFHFAFLIGRKTLPWRYALKPMPWHWNLAYRIADLLVFKNLRSITGGRAEAVISGGAPLSQEIAEFFFIAGFSILEGYGLSECCILSVNRPTQFKFGSVGIPFEGITLKIAPDGEIIVRGDVVMKGYYNRPSDTAEVIDSEGWFHTGDIGEIDSDGFIRITDRKKDLIILAGGKKVAPQPIENSLKGDPLIDGVCLIGDRRPYMTVLIIPNLELCKSWGAKQGFKIETLQDCINIPALRHHFQRTLDHVNSGLPRYSTIKYFELLSSPFSIETGELTPTLKLKRRVVQEKYAREIDALYDAHKDFSRNTAS